MKLKLCISVMSQLKFLTFLCIKTKAIRKIMEEKKHLSNVPRELINKRVINSFFKLKCSFVKTYIDQWRKSVRYFFYFTD